MSSAGCTAPDCSGIDGRAFVKRVAGGALVSPTLGWVGEGVASHRALVPSLGVMPRHPRNIACQAAIGGATGEA
jgi:hypothetical protein